MSFPWLIAEPGTRWLRLTRRFAPAMLPSPDLELSIVSLEAAQIAARLRSGQPSVVLWSFESEASAKDNLKALSGFFHSPPPVSTLHFVVVDPRLPVDARLSLLQWGVIIMDRPEDLPKHGPMVTRFWNRER